MTTSGTGPIKPNVPITNLGNLYINGARLSYTSTTSFTVGTGQVRDSTDTVDIIIGGNQYSSSTDQGGESGTTNNTSTPVVVSQALSGAGGVDVGTVAASTFYYVYVIGDSRGFNSGSAVMSLAAPSVGPSLPLGYDCYRYVGGVSTNSTPHIRPFMQNGAQALRTIWYDPGSGPSTKGVAIPSSPTTGSSTYINVGVLTTLVPQAQVECLFDCDLIGSSAGDALYLAPATIDNGTTATVGSVTNMSAIAGTYHQLAQLRCPVSLPNATQIAALTITNVVTALVATTTTDAIVILLSGYVDQL